MNRNSLQLNELVFLFAEAAYAHLHDWRYLAYATSDAGVTPASAHVLVAEVGVRVQVQH